VNGVFGRDTSKKTTEEELREARNHLELRVADRTAELEKANADLDASTDRLFGRDM
jgi:C4-dicarboxylate-specific signal transduction histidine kinase